MGGFAIGLLRRADASVRIFLVVSIWNFCENPALLSPQGDIV